jgi:tryptophan synthase alpha chain
MEQNLKISKLSQSITDSELKPAFIPFIVAGYPDMESTKDLLKLFQNKGAAAIELGLPFSDPLADGHVIQQAANESLKNGTNVENIFELLEGIKHEITTPIIIFTYFNLVLHYGLDNFINRAKECNIAGLIVPDLPYEESDELRNLCNKADLDLIMLVAPTSGKERIEMISKVSKGFIYMVSSTGVTGVRSSFSESLREVLKIIKNTVNLPVAVGFGVSENEHIKELSKMNVQGAIVGSAIIKVISEYKENKKLLLNKVSEFIDVLYQG